MYGVMADESGLYYMRARFYNPEIRRFVNQDILLGSIDEGQTLNRYAYVTGNPVSLIDPYGLFADYVWDIPIIIYDIYYGFTEGDWIPLGIDLPLAVAPIVPAGAGMLGCGMTKGLVVFSRGQAKIALKSAQEAYKGSTRVGHALSKHAGRKIEIWGKVTGFEV